MSQKTSLPKIGTSEPDTGPRFQKGFRKSQRAGQGSDFNKDSPGERCDVKKSCYRPPARPQSAENYPQNPRQVDRQNQIYWQEADSSQYPKTLTIIP